MPTVKAQLQGDSYCWRDERFDHEQENSTAHQ